MAGATIARQPIVRVSATSDQLPAPATLPYPAVARRESRAAPTVAESLMSPRSANVAKHESPPAPTVAESPNSSPWSPPPGADVQPGRSGVEASAPNTNGVSGAHSPEYEADRRGGHPQGEPAAAQFEGTIEGTRR